VKLLDTPEFQARAGAVFVSVAEQLAQLLPDARVEHVGASAVPGAITKGDLDICVLVAPNSHQSTVATLESSGYVVKTGTLRSPELCMLLSPRTDLDVALQVVAKGSRFEFFMHFRDALRADPLLVQQYNQLKRNFASQGAERYRDEKAAFIESVLRLPAVTVAARQ
jgi:GrpB-like predicted nucleotidyltransferase (UPF0157 family)